MSDRIGGLPDDSTLRDHLQSLPWPLVLILVTSQPWDTSNVGGQEVDVERVLEAPRRVRPQRRAAPAGQGRAVAPAPPGGSAAHSLAHAGVPGYADHLIFATNELLGRDCWNVASSLICDVSVEEAGCGGEAVRMQRIEGALGVTAHGDQPGGAELEDVVVDRRLGEAE